MKQIASILLMVTGIGIPHYAFSQCGLVAEITALGCANAQWPPVTELESWMQVEITAGIPPFQIQYSGSPNYPIPALGTFTFPEFIWGALPQQYQIIDGNGCVTSNFPQEQPITLSPGWQAWVPNQYSQCPNDPCQVQSTVDGGFLYNAFTGNANVRLGEISHRWQFLEASNFTLSGPINMSGTVAGLPLDGLSTGCDCSPHVLPNLVPGTYTLTMTNNGAQNIVYEGWPVEDCSFGSPRSMTFTLPVAPFTLGDAGINIAPQIALGGAMPTSGTLMNDNLRSSGLLTLTEPYSAIGYSFIPNSSAGASIAQSLLNTTGSNAIVDWVIVEIRSMDPPYTVLASRPALVQRDGDVVDLDGDQYVNFPSLSPANYRVAVRHRNHLGIMSDLTSLSLVPAQVSLRDINASLYGTNATTSINGVRCLWPGDANGNGTVRYTGTDNDRDLILTAIGGATPTNTVMNTYSPLDINMDGTIRYTGTNNDRDIILETIGGVVPTATRTQQLP
ncbi:MAG: hypothetical protein WAR83_00210 [Flavobacteriales bacterium]|nr:hypothetical protein [Flavobacteriales bacterium]